MPLYFPFPCKEEEKYSKSSSKALWGEKGTVPGEGGAIWGIVRVKAAYSSEEGVFFEECGVLIQGGYAR